jgi:hypothetical protein
MDSQESDRQVCESLSLGTKTVESEQAYLRTEFLGSLLDAALVWPAPAPVRALNDEPGFNRPCAKNWISGEPAMRNFIKLLVVSLVVVNGVAAVTLKLRIKRLIETPASE